MKFSLYILFTIFSAHLIAQPTIGPEALVQLGESVPTHFFNISEQEWNSGISGEDVEWDYSSLPVGPGCDYLAMDPAESPYFDSFPDSDVFFLCTQEDGSGVASVQYTYYNIENNAFQLAGNVTISAGNPSYDSIFTVFTDPLDVGTFPYNYKDETEDTFSARVSTYTSTINIFAVQSGTSTHVVDSYGTLTTPAGTFPNAMRVKRTELAETVLPGIPFPTFQESYRYTWYAENEKGVILNLDSLVTKDFSGNVVLETFNGNYRMDPPTSTSTKTIAEVEWSVYSTANQIEIQLTDSKDYAITVYDMRGSVVQYTILEQSNNRQVLQLEGSVTDGIYYISLRHQQSGKTLSKGLFLSAN